MKDKKQDLEDKVDAKRLQLIERGFKDIKVEKRIKEYKKELKEKRLKDERAYWKHKQDKKFGKISDINQQDEKDYLKCLKKR